MLFGRFLGETGTFEKFSTAGIFIYELPGVSNDITDFVMTVFDNVAEFDSLFTGTSSMELEWFFVFTHLYDFLHFG